MEKKTYVIKCGTTHHNVRHLEPNEVFVFGSNLQGHHGGGAAAFAMEHFGAEWGIGVGMTGKCYAIPTMQGGVETIKPYVDQFIAFAKSNPDMLFLVIKIGCGIAGFRTKDIAPLFAEALELSNVSLPAEFIYDLRKIYSCITFAEHLETYGQLRTIVDLLKTYNDEHPGEINSAERAYEGIVEVARILSCRGAINGFVRRAVYFAPELFQFKDGKFDFDRFTEQILHSGWEEWVYDNIINTRSLAKLYKIIKLMNSVKKYQSGEVLRQDILRYVFDGLAECGATDSWLNDSDLFGSEKVKNTITRRWKELISDGVLDNEKLETLFGKFERELRDKGIARVADENYHSYCGGILMSEQPGYPALYSHDDGKIDVWCEMRSFNIINSYEWTHLEEFIRSVPEYDYVTSDDDKGFYYPREDDDRPIFLKLKRYEWIGEMVFPTKEQRLQTLGNLRKGIR